MTCTCGKPALIRLLNVPFCVDCYHAHLGTIQDAIRAFAKRLTEAS